MRIAPGVLAALLAAGLPACSSNAEPREVSEAPARPPTEPSGATPASDTPALPPPEPRIEASWGISVSEPAPDPARAEALRARLRDALGVHGEGRYEESRVAFAAIVEEEPGYDAARFDLACALSRLGRVDEAAAQMRIVLARDLPTYLGRLERDADLAALRAALAMGDLGAHVRAASAAWERAIAEGLLATHRRRVGVLLRRDGRFLPVVATEVEGDVAVDLAARRAGFAIAGWEEGEVEADGGYVVRAIVTEAFAPPAPTLHRRRVAVPVQPDDLYRFVYATGENIGFAGLGTVDRAGRFRAGADRATRPFPHEVPPPGFALRGNDLVAPEAEPVRLSRGHGAALVHSFAFDPARGVLFVASTRDTGREPEAFETYVTRHATVVDRVDLRTREVVCLGTVRDRAFVMAHAGDAYVVGLPGGARRHPGFGAEHEALPDGVVPLPPARR